MNSDGSSDMQTINLLHHFKRRHDKGKIANNTLKMADNNLRLLKRHHILWHGSRIFPYFDFGNMNFVKDRIKGIAKTKMDKIEVKIKEFMEAGRKFWMQRKRKELIRVSKFPMFRCIMY